MSNLKASELVLAPDGSVYHVRVKSENLADDIIIVGDPGRVPEISKYFESIDFKVQNREIVVHTGRYNGKRITALSTGMGPDNIDIVINELDAAVNIDLEKREIKTERRHLNIVRIGTSGALNASVPVNSVVASVYGVGLDGVASFYALREGVLEENLAAQFIEQTGWAKDLPSVYVTKGSAELLNRLGEGFYHGITTTAPGFYGPQGRSLRIPLKYPEYNDKFANVELDGKPLLNFEMETSALYMLCKELGHNALTCCLVIANRVTGDFAKDYHPQVEQLIKTILERLTK